MYRKVALFRGAAKKLYVRAFLGKGVQKPPPPKKPKKMGGGVALGGIFVYGVFVRFSMRRTQNTPKEILKKNTAELQKVQDLLV
jgi:hypothetical protein